jgi:hypothetical protein
MSPEQLRFPLRAMIAPLVGATALIAVIGCQVARPAVGAEVRSDPR